MNDVKIPGQLTAVQANAIFHIAEDAIVSVDAQQRIILFNFGAEKMFGYLEQDVLGQPLDMLLPEANRAQHAQHIRQFAQSANPAKRMGERAEISGRRKDGSLFPTEASICFIDDGDEKIFTAILRDVTERKAQNEELMRAKEDAEAADYAKSMFLANMSHEIRTPLNAVVGMTSLLLDTQLSHEQSDCAQTIRSSSEALLSIINDILDYSKIEVGKLELENHPFDLRTCIEESLDLVSPIAGEKMLNLAYLIDDGVPAVIVSDVTRLRQVLVNLLGNATKFTHRGEILVTAKAELTETGSYHLQFSVSDTGIGIAPDRVDELFKSFNQLDPSTTRKYGGSGLGLAISRRLVEIMGGDMWVETEPGEGSTFHFHIIADAGSDDLARSFLQEHAIELTAKRVLIVDDNMTNRRILVKQSLLWGMVPTATASGVEAMDLVRHGHAFDLAVLDMSMPEMDGLALAQQIRQYRSASSLPMIMLTSLSQKPKKALLEKVEFSAFLSKPIKASHLFEVFKTSLGVEADTRLPDTFKGFDATLAQKNPLMILVAEDNAINQKVVQQILQKFGYRSDLASNGLEVLDALERQRYDLILMDLNMPEMGGVEAAQRIKQHFPEEQRPRIVAMTANVQPSDRSACVEAGMQDFLAKPVKLEKLCNILAGVNSDTGKETEIQLQLDSEEIERARLEMILMSQDHDDPDLLESIVDIFLQEAEPCMQAMTAAIDESRWQKLSEEAHRFYTSCSNLGLLKMSEICMQLEVHANKNDVDKTVLMKQMYQAYVRVKPDLERLSSGQG